MILIADSGGTKIEWSLIDGLEEVKRFKTKGFNAIASSLEEIDRQLETEVLPHFVGVENVDRLFFYGAGCIGDAAESVRTSLQRCFEGAVVEVNSDLLGAAKAMCGTQSGIVCILGTGSNTCYYDGEKIIMNVPPMGYILGDEGSGAVLGRLLISDVFKGQLPKSLCDRFFERYNLTLNDVLKHVYREQGANRFLASVTPFLLEHLEEPAIHRLVLNNFKSFFIRNITRYPDYQNTRINVTGSIGWYFRDVLREAAESMDCTLGKMCKSPMDGLIEYYIRGKFHL